MPRVTLHIDEQHGPLVPVSLRPEPNWAEILRQQQREVPQQVQGWALIDTGARQTAVDDRVGGHLYKQVGVAQVFTPSTADETPHDAPVYFAVLAFPNSDLPLIEQMVLGMALGYPVQGKPVLVLLGRDFLADKRMVYDGVAGSVDLTW